MRLQDDRRRATELQTPAQRRVTETILQRAVALGAEAVALTGSTVRAKRTTGSDLDFMVVGERPDLGGVHEDVDVYAANAEAFWERLLAGDDYIQWTLRFGCVLHDNGILKAACGHIEESGLAPSAERKLIQAETAREQCRSALTVIARWLLIANGEFPLCRGELADQLVMLGCPELATALHQLIHDEPSSEEMRAGLELGEKLTSVPQSRQSGGINGLGRGDVARRR
jgi:hypothetical protein